MLKLKPQYFGHLMQRADSFERHWCWERLRAGEGDDRGWDGWVASPSQSTWVWVHSRSWWWTGRHGVLWFMGSQRVGHDWATEMNWTELNWTILQSNLVHGVLQARRIFYQLNHKWSPRIWSQWFFPFPGNLPDPGIEPGFPALQADLLPTELSRKPYEAIILQLKNKLKKIDSYVLL